MNKAEFLDMLKDYLIKYYTEEEIFEILRDYEEYFINGKLDGKTEQDIILELGSPKKIVMDLIEEDGVEKNGLFFTMKEKFYGWYDRKFFERVQRKNGENFVGSDRILKNKDSKFSFILTNIFLLFLHVIIFTMVMFLVGILVGLVFLTLGGVVSAVILTPITINGLTFLSMTNLWIVFPVLLAVGLFILMSVIIYYFSKFLYKFILEYINWVKTQMMYKKAENNMNSGQVRDDIKEEE